MCYAYPGPRCSRHVKNDIKKYFKLAKQSQRKAEYMGNRVNEFESANDKYKREDVDNEYKKNREQRTLYRNALEQYKQTPAGLKILRKSAIESGMTPEQMDQIDKEIKEDNGYELIDKLSNPYSNAPNAVHEYIRNKGARQLQLNNYNNGTNQSNSTLPSTTEYEVGRVQREHQRAQKNKMDNRFPETGSTGDATLHLAQKEQEEVQGNFVKRQPSADAEVYLAKNGEESPYTQTPTSASSQGSHLSENYYKTTPYEGAEVLIGKDKTTIIPPKPKEKPVFPTHRPKS